MKKCKHKLGNMEFAIVTGEEKEALPGTHLARTHFGGKYLTLRSGERGNVIAKGTYIVYEGPLVHTMTKAEFDERYIEIKEPAKTKSTTKKKTGGKGANK